MTGFGIKYRNTIVGNKHISFTRAVFSSSSPELLLSYSRVSRELIEINSERGFVIRSITKKRSKRVKN